MLENYPGQVVTKFTPRKTHYFLVFVLTSLLWWTACAVIYIEGKRQNDLLIDEISTRQDQVAVDDGILQLIFEGGYSRDAIELTDVTVSAYSSTKDQTDDTPFVNAAGENTMIGQIAVSRDILNNGAKLGDVVFLTGLGAFRITDVMAPRWKRKVDIYCGSREACRRFGLQQATMIWMKR